MKCAVGCPGYDPDCCEPCCFEECCDTADCDDGNACTDDSCVGNACVHETVVCDDGNGCTEDNCDPAIGCLVVPGHVMCGEDCCNVKVVGDGPVCQGENYQFGLQCDANTFSVIWSVSGNSNVNITPGGMLFWCGYGETALPDGSVTVTATSLDDNSCSDSVDVQIFGFARPGPNENISTSQVANLDVSTGATFGTIYYANGNDQCQGQMKGEYDTDHGHNMSVTIIDHAGPSGDSAGAVTSRWSRDGAFVDTQNVGLTTDAASFPSITVGYAEGFGLGIDVVGLIQWNGGGTDSRSNIGTWPLHYEDDWQTHFPGQTYEYTDEWALGCAGDKIEGFNMTVILTGWANLVQDYMDIARRPMGVNQCF